MNVRIFFIAAGLLTTIMVSCQNQSAKVELNTEFDTISYYLGISVGHNLVNSPLKEVNVDAFAQGIQEVIDGEEHDISLDEINNTIGMYMQALEQAQADIYLEESEAFLAENKKRKGVITTGSGLQYEIIKQGYGPKPKATDQVTVHYHGTLIDGQVFDSSVERGSPATFPLNRVIAGWTEGLQLMNVGSKFKFYIPPDLAYGSNPRPGGLIKPNMALIFEVELLSIEPVDSDEGSGAIDPDDIK